MSDNCSFDYRIWHIKSIVALLFLFIILTACVNKFPKQIEQYYYPIEQLENGEVYEYETQSNNGSVIKSYWVFTKTDSESGALLTGKYYNAKYEHGQTLEQKIHSSGALLNNYELFIPVDSIFVKIPVEILYKNVFPFEVKDTTSVYLYKLEYINPQDSSSNTITRNRRYIKSLQWDFNQKPHSAIQMSLLEQIINEKEGAITIDLMGYEIYIEDIGLVYTERISKGGSTRIVDKLVDRYPFSEFPRD